MLKGLDLSEISSAPLVNHSASARLSLSKSESVRLPGPPPLDGEFFTVQSGVQFFF